MKLISCRSNLSLLSGMMLCAACGGGGGGAPSASAPLPNRAPTVVSQARTERVVVDRAFSYDILQHGPIFSDPDGDTLTYRLSWNMWNSVDGPQVWSGLRLNGTRVEGTTASTWTNQILIEASDGHGGVANHRIELVAARNGVPVVSAPNTNRIVGVGVAVEFDVTGNSTAFTDPDGDELTYTVTIEPSSHGLLVNGTVVSGSLDSLGAVRIVVTARDEYEDAATDTFLVAAPYPEPGAPTLPVVSHTYDDALLGWPEIFRLSREIRAPFPDTTPVENATTNAGATLGRVLFYDRRLSITNSHACGSCHEQSRGFTVGTRFAEGVPHEPSRRNPMALANARYNFFNRYFSDVRVTGLEQLALMPIEDPLELGNSMSLAVEKLAATDFYPPLFEAAFGTPEINGERIARALAQFLRSIVSYRSKFDRAYLSVYPLSGADPASVLTEQELLGAAVFGRSDCSRCHLNNTHIMDGVANNGLDAQFSDPGAGNGRFRPASLRNIAVSGPYMHDGRFATLREVIDHYDSGIIASADVAFLLLLDDTPGSETARRLSLTEEEKLALEAFLNTFTDEALLHDPKLSDPFN